MKRMTCLLLLGCLWAWSTSACYEPKPPPSATTDRIGRAGGVFRADNGVILNIPAEALPQPLLFEIKDTADQGPGGSLTLLSTAFEIKPQLDFPEGLPARVIVPLDRSKIPPERYPWDLQVHFKDGDTWKRVPHAIDESTPSIYFDIPKTGIFAIFLGPSLKPEAFYYEIPTPDAGPEPTTPDEPNTEMPPDAGEMTPDAGEMTPDAGEMTPDAGEITPDAGEMTSGETRTEPAPDAGETTPELPADAGESTPEGIKDTTEANNESTPAEPPKEATETTSDAGASD